jgi:AcrR family transcriptional regulator
MHGKGVSVRELSTIQEKILDKALFLIGKQGNFNVSVRDITREADVNVNAVNYYFGSKENMLDQVEEFFIENYLSSYSVLDKELNDEEKLLQWANEITEYILKYPGIQLLMRDYPKFGRNGKMKEFLERDSYQLNQKLDQLIERVFAADDDQLYQIRMIFESALFFPAIVGTDISFDKSKMNDPQFRREYLKFLIDTLKKGVCDK